MPGYRKRKPAYKRKGGFVKKVAGYASMAMKAYALAKYVKSLVNVERKFLDTTQTSSGCNNTAVLIQQTNISEGTDYNQRTGISVKAVSAYIKGFITLPAAATLGHQVRLILLFDSDNTGTAPVASDVLEVNTDINSPIQHTNGKRFKILWDRTLSISQSGPDSVHFKHYFKLGNHIRWSNSTTGTREGHLYLLQFSDTSTANEIPLLSWYHRLRFVDN